MSLGVNTLRLLMVDRHAVGNLKAVTTNMFTYIMSHVFP